MIEIPNKKYFMIGEVAKMCEVKTHVLRYWEGQFPQLKPSKRRGRRYYQRDDVLLILQINDLLNNQRFTVEGAVAQLSQKRVKSTDDNANDVQTDILDIGDKEVLTDTSSLVRSNPDLLGLVGSIKHIIKECQTFQVKLQKDF